MFTGRKEELAILKGKYKTNRLEVISVLGKRRIGKSQLIAESLKDFDGLFISYECYKTSYRANLDYLSENISKTFNNKFLKFNSLNDVILFLYEEASKKPIVLVLDEYPYMREGEATDSEVKNAIDYIEQLEESRPLKIIICGSQIDIMNLLDNSNKPLHGRFTEKIILKPLNYLESSFFYPNSSLEDKVNYYCVFGGIPYFLKQIDENLSFDENIINLLFSNHALIRSELESYINVEIAKIEKALVVLDIVRNKIMSYNDILQVFNRSYPNGSVDYVLNKLIDINVIEKIFIKQSNGALKPYYSIKDYSLKFYYTYLNFHFANRALFTSEDYYKTFIEDDLKHQFIPHMFEKVGSEFVTLMNQKNLLPYKLFDLFPYIINDKINKKNYQFDVVGKVKDGLINFECKYLKNPINKSLIYNENRQAELADESFIATIFISKSPVEGDYKAYYLADLFSEKLL